jgi:hypothetical protein
MDEPSHCDCCGRELVPHAHYLVRIEVLADPSMPPTTSQELADADFPGLFADLIEQMKGLSAQELQDQVYRRFEFKMCPPCQKQYLANPLGKRRKKQVGAN